MRTDKAVYRALSASGIPGTKKAWPEGGAPSLPWFTYEVEDDGVVFADDENSARLPVYRASLYEQSMDPDVEEAFEDAIAEAFGPFSCEEYWIESEGCWMTTYTFTYTGGK